jgi:hypothetical protein
MLLNKQLKNDNKISLPRVFLSDIESVNNLSKRLSNDLLSNDILSNVIAPKRSKEIRHLMKRHGASQSANG